MAERAKADGLRVVADASEADTELVRRLGADLVVPRGDGLADRLLEAVPGGLDAVVDTALLGAASEPAIRPGGQVAPLRRPGTRGARPL